MESLPVNSIKCKPLATSHQCKLYHNDEVIKEASFQRISLESASKTTWSNGEYHFHLPQGTRCKIEVGSEERSMKCTEDSE